MSRIVDTIRRSSPEEPAPRPIDAGRRGNPDLGVVQYFHLGDHDTAERVVEGLERIEVRRLRTAISWCDWTREGGEDWYAWLLPRLTAGFDVLPCFLYTPPELGVMAKTSSPPRDPQAYGRFVEMVLRRHEGWFTHVELWNEPNNYIEWDWTIDPEWVIFAEMIAGAARRASGLGVSSVLGGMSPFDPNWLDLMFKRGALEHVDVVGVHGFPGTWEAVWEGWDEHIGRVEEVLERHGSEASVWVTEAGFSTWAHDEFSQLTTMVQLAEAPADRVYWYSAEDLAPERETLDGFHCDERAYHFGLQRRDGRPKLLARVLAERGLEGVRELCDFSQADSREVRGGVLVAGGAGALGSRLVDHLASNGTLVTILDSLVRPGSERDLRRLKEKHGARVRVEIGDVRDTFAVRRGLAGCDAVFQLAAVAHASDPRVELEVNLVGTFNLLEELRRLERPPAIVFASLQELDLATPHACSIGAADGYVLGYARTFGLSACVVRVGAASAAEVVGALVAAAGDDRALRGGVVSVPEPARPGGGRSRARSVAASDD